MTLNTVFPVGTYQTTILAEIDFETYSEAGYTFDGKKWKALGAKGGLSAVGSMIYSLHDSTEVLCAAYDLKDGLGRRLWLPTSPAPIDLFMYIQNGGLIEAHNASFEHHIWNNVCVRRYGWPELPFMQQRDSMAKCRAFSLPAALGKAVLALGLPEEKDTEGKRLITKFCRPRNPTVKDPRTRILPTEDLIDGELLYKYCLQDIVAEAALSRAIPDLIPDELDFWLNTCASNYRGVGVRVNELEDCIAILEQAYARYNLELSTITQGQVTEASKVAQLQTWCASQGLTMADMDNDAIDSALKLDIPDHIKRVLEIRQLISSAGVKKVYAMRRIATPEQRLCDLFIYHGARTGRDTGADVQPQNLVKAGVKLTWCSECDKPSGQHHKETCPHCGASVALFGTPKGWSWQGVDHVLEAMSTQSLDYVEYIFGDAVLAVSGCIRGLFVAKEGHTLIASDYSSIEAVVTAVLSGEQWRIDAFHAGQDIYLVSAAAIKQTTLEWYMANGGKEHPDRQKIGKPSELGLGFGGWLGAWRQFDSSDTFTDDEAKQLIVKWREASPMIVEMWGGQTRGKSWAPDSYELYGLEGAAIQAVMNVGQCFSYRTISFGVKDDVLYCRLPSGRNLTYHRPRVAPSSKGAGLLELTYEGWNSNPKMGRTGWFRLNTYGGRLMENCVQAVARDIMRDAVNNLEKAGYPVVLRVHDEIVAEVPIGFGSIEEFERIMATLPAWAEGWPIRAAGGWMADRYRKG